MMTRDGLTSRLNVRCIAIHGNCPSLPDRECYTAWWCLREVEGPDVLRLSRSVLVMMCINISQPKGCRYL